MELMIGETILRLRKEKGYTQEDIANALHISCAAVSKWETKASYPDITLLLPLARFFEISLDELLDYSKTLNDEEIRTIQVDCQLEFKKGDIEKALHYCEKQLREYPNSESLALAIASLYNYQNLVHPEYDKHSLSKLEERAFKLLNDLTSSKTTSLADSATMLCATIYQKQGDYEKAISLLTTRVQPFDVSLNLVSLYQLSEKKVEALRLLQQVIIKNCSQLCQAMSMLSHIKNDDQVSRLIMKDLTSIANVFKQSSITSMAALLEVEYYAKKQEKKATLEALKHYFDCFQSTDTPSIYFDQLVFNTSLLEIQHIQEQFLASEEMFDFIRNETSFKELQESIKKTVV